MTVLKKLKDYLDKNRVSYEVITHREAFTAQEIAANLHVPGKQLAKVVMVKTGDRFVMTVLPAAWRIDLNKLKKMLKDKKIKLATEEEFKGLFPDCDVGAMPPFGNLYNLETYVDTSLIEDEEIFFNAGTHFEVVRMKYKDFAGLVNPKVGDFAVHLT